MKITRKQLREIIIEQLGNGGGLRLNVRDKTDWEAWVREVFNDEEVIENDDEEENSKSE